MADQAKEQERIAADVEAHKDHPSLIAKMRQAQDQYDVGGINENADMHAYITELLRRIEHERAVHARAATIRRRKRKNQKQARKRNRGR